MTVVTGLKICAISLPLIGALAVRLARERYPLARRRLAAMVLGAVGLAALSLFFLDGHYACALASGRKNCLFDGLASLSLSALSLVLAMVALADRPSSSPQGGRDYALWLLLIGAWAGMGLAENLLVLLISSNLLLYVVHRWLRARGLTWRFLVVRDDYRDDPKGRR